MSFGTWVTYLFVLTGQPGNLPAPFFLSLTPCFSLPLPPAFPPRRDLCLSLISTLVPGSAHPWNSQVFSDENFFPSPFRVFLILCSHFLTVPLFLFHFTPGTKWRNGVTPWTSLSWNSSILYRLIFRCTPFLPLFCPLAKPHNTGITVRPLFI